MKLNFSALAFLEFLCYYIIAGFFLHYISARYNDKPFGKALAFVS